MDVIGAVSPCRSSLQVRQNTSKEVGPLLMDAGNWRDGASNSQLIILHSVYLTTFRMSNKLNNQNYRFNKKLDLS